MVAAYAVLGRSGSNLAIAALMGLIVVPVVSVSLPVYWTTAVRRQPISSLGITLRGWAPSVVLSIILRLIVLAPLFLSSTPTVARIDGYPWPSQLQYRCSNPSSSSAGCRRTSSETSEYCRDSAGGSSYSPYHVGYMPAAMTGQFYSAVVFAV